MMLENNCNCSFPYEQTPKKHALKADRPKPPCKLVLAIAKSDDKDYSD